MKIAPHTLIHGKTDSGKSTMARRLILERFKPAGYKILVLDPKQDPRFQADFMTNDAEEFMRVVKSHAGVKCFGLVDESGEKIGAYAGHMRVLATQYRELAHRYAFIVQRAAMLDKNIVLNCGNLFLFESSGRDCKTLSEDFDSKILLEGTQLKQGEYLFKPRFGDIVRGNVFAGLKKSA